MLQVISSTGRQSKYVSSRQIHSSKGFVHTSVFKYVFMSVCGLADCSGNTFRSFSSVAVVADNFICSIIRLVICLGFIWQYDSKT